MFKELSGLGQTGAATAVAVVALVAVTCGAIGTPIVVDTVADQQPNSPLYGLEIAGEKIKEATFAGGQEWHLKRAQERLQEFQDTKEGDVSNNHVNLLQESQERLTNAANKAKNIDDVEKIRQTIRNHFRVLERVENKVPEHAKQALERAVVRMRVQEKAINEIREKIRRGEVSPGHLKEELENKFNSIENIVKILENRELPSGIFKKIVENREISFDNLKDLMENRKIPPGIVKQLLENNDISLDELKDFLEGKNLPRGIVWNILRDRGISIENIRDFLQDLGLPGRFPENTENIEEFRDNFRDNFREKIENFRDRMRGRIENRLSKENRWEKIENFRDRIRERIENRVMWENTLENFENLENLEERIREHIGRIRECIQNRLENRENILENLGPPENRGPSDNPGSGRGNSEKSNDS